MARRYASDVVSPFGVRGILAAGILGLAACSDEAIEPGSPPRDCPSGSTLGPGDACMPVGIAPCAPEFVGGDGSCRPALDRCPAGRIPKFDEGCVPVGLDGCAPEFLADDGVCRPPPAACGSDAFPVPQLGCVPLDGPDGCGSGTWGNVPDGPGTVYVDPAATEGGDGSKMTPVKTVAAALAKVASGGRVVLAAGEYDEPAILDKPVTLVGRCPSLVGLHGVTTEALLPAIVHVRKSEGVVLEGVRLSGAGVGVLADGAKVTVRRSVIRGATLDGVLAVGPAATLDVERTLIAETLPRASDQELGRGVEAGLGAKVNVRESAVLGTRDLGVYALAPGTSVAIDRSLVADTAPRASDKKFGRGILAEDGARVTVTESVLLRNHEAGAVALGADTELSLEGSVVGDTLPRASDGLDGRGISTHLGATVRLVRSAVVGNRDYGVFVTTAGTRLEVDTTLVANTLPRASDQQAGRGIDVESGALATVKTIAVVGAHEVGVRVSGAGTRATLEGALVAGTLPRASDQRLGYGVEASFGADVRLEGSAVVGNRTLGVHAVSTGTKLAIDRSLVADTLPRASDGAFGRGLAVASGASAVVTQSLFVGNQEFAVDASAAEELVVDRSLLADTRPLPDGSYGVGIASTATPTTVSGSRISNATTAGMLFVGSPVTVSSTRIDGVAPGVFHLYEGPVGMEKIVSTFDGIADGLVGGFDSVIDATDVVIRDASRSGLVIDASRGTLRDVRSSGGAFGLVVQGNPKPDWSDTSNAFTGSAEDVVSDGALPVPGPPKIPLD